MRRQVWAGGKGQQIWTSSVQLADHMFSVVRTDVTVIDAGHSLQIVEWQRAQGFAPSQQPGAYFSIGMCCREPCGHACT